ncbi:MAG: hypothetical protein PUP93_25460 [Rhizonema sp. NSF051]|nr:hypothetical protein [Rhizonema sp. NSF051]
MSNITTLRKFSLVAAGSVLLTFGAFEAAQASSFAVFNSGVNNFASGNNTVTVLPNRKNSGTTNVTNGSEDFRRVYGCKPYCI